MDLSVLVQFVYRHFRNVLWRLSALTGKIERFECPICNYHGPFRPLFVQSGTRTQAQCQGCYSLERHRLQMLVLRQLDEGKIFSGKRILHFAPESFLKRWFRERTTSYETADLVRASVDHKVDMTRLPFEDASFDVVFASHVMEHIRDDDRAISEVHRILRPHGLAILPVPIVAPATVEYPTPNPQESNHVRAPGPDYFDRYRKYFGRVQVYNSSQFPEKYQTWTLEDRSAPDPRVMPWRVPMPGNRHPDFVPVCWK